MHLQSPSKFSHTPEDYMYDDYPDYQFTNITDQATSEDMTKSSTSSPNTLTTHTQTGPISFTRPSSSSSSTNSLIKPPHKKKHPPIPPSPSSSGFTFFGVPLPNLSFNLWGNSSKKSQRREDGHPSRGRYRTFPPSEPEVQKGGFYPLPQPQGGFVPIADPRFTLDNPKLKDLKNGTMKSNRTATVTRVFHPPGRKKMFKPSNTSTSTSSFKSHKTNHEETTTLQMTTDSPTSPSGPEVIKIPSSTTTINFPIPQDLSPTSSNKSISISTEVYNSENLDVDSEETIFVEGKLASKIVWTTPGVIDTSESLLNTAATEGIYRSKNHLFESEDHTSLVKPEGTSPMGPEDPVIYVTTEHSDEAVTIGNDGLLVQNNKGMEASALSAFLVPGGQVGSTPQVIARTLGRSTIEKVASPHLGNQSRSGKIKPDETMMKGDVEVEGSGEGWKGVRESTYGPSDDPFNWYFQNYNESNLEPFVGVVYSGNNGDSKVVSIFWIVGGMFVFVRVFM